jgi:ATP-dependent RNA helicase DeaD
MEKRPFAELGLSPEVLKAVDKLGYEEATPIQTAVIGVAMAGRDVVGQSATGSGKTAAFAIPAIEMSKAQVHKVQCLILCPTRELAVQVAEETGKLLLFKRGLNVVPIYGGQSYERQFRALAAGVQIVIGTPGRVMDHMERGTLKLDGLRMVVLDEADRMLDMGFRDDIERILSATPPERQTLFFSATMPRAIQDLIGRHRPERFPLWADLLQHQGDGRRTRRAPACPRLLHGPAARRSEPDAAHARDGEISAAGVRISCGDRRGRARAGRR